MNQNNQKVGISAISHYLPEKIRTSTDIEKLINQNLKPGITKGSIQRLTGIKQRYVSVEHEYNSTLAIAACKKLFAKEKINPKSVDLLIFASTGQDILEPATSHIIQAEIGTSCPVMDITNACNSFLNALEVAVVFVEAKKYKRILIATGEVPSKSAKYEIESRHSLNQYLPGYTFGDAGTAVLITEDPTIATVKDFMFFADSTNWDVAMFPGGGSRFLNKRDAYFFSGDANSLMQPFFLHTKRLMDEFLTRNAVAIEQIDHVFVHQVAELFLGKISDQLGIADSKIQVTIKDYGNVAAASLPLALDLRMKSAVPPSPGSLGLFIGLAGGVSIGFSLVEF
ncbi:MAG: ketoacyl-ACP synthase III [Patescibacteria group bacterium]